MKTSTRFFSWLVVCFMAVSIACLSLTGYRVKAAEFKTIEPGVLTVATSTGFPPFEYVGDDGKPDGFDVAFIKAIGEKLGLQVKVEDMEFNALVASVGNKTDVAIAGMTVTDERKLAVDFSDSYYDAVQYVLVRKGSNIRCMDDLHGATLAAQIGTTGNLLADDIVKENPQTVLKTYDRFPEAVNDLKAERVDAIILDKTPAQTFEGIYRGEIEAIPGDDFDFEVEEYAIALPKGSEQLGSAINKAIAELKSDGTYDRIINEYINADGGEKSNGIVDQFVSAFITSNRWTLYLNGLCLTIQIAFFAALVGIVVGTLLALMKIAKNRKGKRTILSFISGIYIDIVRGTPLVLQLLIMWFIVMKNSKDGVLVAVVAFGLNSAAYVAEIIRAGILAVDSGQMEAGRSMGFTRAQTMCHIILPQAVKNALPPLCNEFISLLKETAIVGYVALSDLTRVANQISSATYQPFVPLIGAAVIYFVVIKILTLLLGVLERRLRKGDIR